MELAKAPTSTDGSVSNASSAAEMMQDVDGAPGRAMPSTSSPATSISSWQAGQPLHQLQTQQVDKYHPPIMQGATADSLAAAVAEAEIELRRAQEEAVAADAAAAVALARQSVAQQALATAAQRLSRARSNTSSERSGSVQSSAVGAGEATTSPQSPAVAGPLSSAFSGIAGSDSSGSPNGPTAAVAAAVAAIGTSSPASAEASPVSASAIAGLAQIALDGGGASPCSPVSPRAMLVLRGCTSWHSDYKSMAVIPGNRIVGGSSDGTIRIWDTITGVMLNDLKGHTDAVAAMTILQDGRLASGGFDKVIKLWDIASGTCTSELRGHTNMNGTLASGSWDATIRLWDVHYGACMAVFSGHEGWLSSIAQLPDGRLASGAFDKRICIWNVTTMACEAVLFGHEGTGKLPVNKFLKSHIPVSPGTPATPKEAPTGFVHALAVLADGRLASAGGDETIRIWNVSTGMCEKVITCDPDAVAMIALSGGSKLFAGHKDGVARVWSVERGEVEQQYPGHTSWVYAVAELPDGRMVTASADNTFHIFVPKQCQQPAS